MAANAVADSLTFSNNHIFDTDDEIYAINVTFNVSPPLKNVDIVTPGQVFEAFSVQRRPCGFRIEDRLRGLDPGQSYGKSEPRTATLACVFVVPKSRIKTVEAGRSLSLVVVHGSIS